MTIVIGDVVGTGTFGVTDTLAVTLTEDIPISTPTEGSGIIIVVTGEPTNSAFYDNLDILERVTDDAPVGLPYRQSGVSADRIMQKVYLTVDSDTKVMWMAGMLYIALNAMPSGTVITINYDPSFLPGFQRSMVRLHAVTGLRMDNTNAPNGQDFDGGAHIPTMYVSGAYRGSFSRGGTDNPGTFTDLNDMSNPSSFHDLLTATQFVEKKNPTDVVTMSWANPTEIAGAPQYTFEWDYIYFGYSFGVYPVYPSTYTTDTLSYTFGISPSNSVHHGYGMTLVYEGPGWPYPVDVPHLQNEVKLN